MKKITAVCLIAFITLTAFTHYETIKGSGHITTENRTVTGFDKLSIAGSTDVIIDENGKEGVTVETDDNLQSYVITEVEKGTLKIHFKKDAYLKPTKIIIHVSCKELNTISSGGSGDVTSTSKLTGDALQISNGGSGNYKINVAVKALEINSGGSGDFVLTGSAEEFIYSGAGSGDVMAKDLTCVKGKISTAGSGDVVLKRGTKAQVSSVGSGDVSYE